MLIDTHCHLNNIIKEKFDISLSKQEVLAAATIINEASENDVKIIINVGTSLIESENSLLLAKNYKNVYASVGIHPNDLTDTYKSDLQKIKEFLKLKVENKIVAIGEAGIDRHYPDYDLKKQSDAFKIQIEMALEHDLALIVHSRDAQDETLRCLEEYKKDNLRGTIHCFSYDLSFAREVISFGFALGIGGTLTYPKNETLREVVKSISLGNIILETDAPFLPPQSLRGRKNEPKNIKIIAEYITNLTNIPFVNVCDDTTENALKIFKINY